MDAATVSRATVHRARATKGKQVGLTEVPTARERVLVAAAEAFMERGYSGTSIDDIADCMRATKGAVYHHFTSKSDVYFAVQERAIRRIDSIVRPIFDSALPLDMKLVAMAHAHASAIFSDFPAAKVGVQGLERSLMQSTGVAERRRFNTILRQRRAYEAMFSKVIRLGIEEGIFAGRPIEVIVNGLLGALNWTTTWFDRTRRKSPAELDQLAASLAAYAVRGVLAHQTPPVSSSSPKKN